MKELTAEVKRMADGIDGLNMRIDAVINGAAAAFKEVDLRGIGAAARDSGERVAAIFNELSTTHRMVYKADGGVRFECLDTGDGLQAKLVCPNCGGYGNCTSPGSPPECMICGTCMVYEQ